MLQPSLSADTGSDDLNPNKYKLYSSRWIALTLFCCMEMANALLWVTYAPISDISQHYFGSDNYYSSITAVNMLANVYLILYPVGTILAVYCVKRIKPRNSLLLGGLFSVIGAFMRWIASTQKQSLGNDGVYLLMFFGQAFGAMSQPFFTNFVPALSSIWFAVEERDISTAIGSMCSPLGNAIGQLIPPIIVTETVNATGGYDVKNMDTLMLVEFILNVLPLVAAYFFLKDGPPTPPSHSTKLKQQQRQQRGALDPQTEEKQSEYDPESPTSRTIDAFSHSASAAAILSRRPTGELKNLLDENNHTHNNSELDDITRSINELKSLLANRNFVLLATAFCIGVGYFNALMTLLNQIVNPFGYSNDDAGTFGAVFIISGLVGAGIMGKCLEVTKSYQGCLMTCVVLASMSNFLCFCLLYTNNFWPLTVCFGLLGLTVLPLLPAMLENCAECTFPVSEELSAGFLYSGSNLSALAFIFVLQYLIGQPAFGPPPLLPSTFFIFGMMLSAALILVLYKADYRRMKSEKQQPNADGEVGKGEYSPPNHHLSSSSSSDQASLVRVGSQDNSSNAMHSMANSSSNIWSSSPQQSRASTSIAGGGTGNDPIRQLFAASAAASATGH